MMEYFANNMVIAIKSFTYMKNYRHASKRNIHKILNVDSVKNGTNLFASWHILFHLILLMSIISWKEYLSSKQLNS